MNLDFLNDYQDLLFLGVICNIFSTFWFGFYKTTNISEEQAMYLVEKYELNPKFAKTVVMWLVPFLGFTYVFVEVFKLQFSYINRGKTVFNYVEDRIKNEKVLK